MHTQILLTLAAVPLIACVERAPEELRRAIPTAQQVEIKFPGGVPRALGQTADWYLVTHEVTRAFNGATGWALDLVHAIVEEPLSSTEGDTYIWGPWRDAEEPAEYKLTVRALEDGQYDYRLLGRRDDDDAAFEAIIDGRAGSGRGLFLLDIDAAYRIDPSDDDGSRGSVLVGYDLAARHLDLDIESVDDTGGPLDLSYTYDGAPDGAGAMSFQVIADAGGTAAREDIALRSRWRSDGAGRADARLANGDVAAVSATASECWDTAFRRVYYIDSAGLAPTEGDAAACAFPTADLPPAPTDI